MARVHPHELLPIVNRQVVQERIILDWASKRFRSLDRRDAIVNDRVVIGSWFGLGQKTIQRRSAGHFPGSQHTAENPFDDGGSQNPGQSKPKTVHASCHRCIQVLANLGEVPILGFRITVRPKVLYLREHFITGVKVQRSFLRGCHGCSL